MASAIKWYTEPLGWNAEKVEAFVQKHTDRPSSEMTIADCTAVLFELQRL
ncbi:MAG TPA: hypothetical protein V6C84_30130 [Coleofasciculaceae cyanobacterium]